MGAVWEKIKQIYQDTLHRGEKLSVNQITRKNLPFFIGWIGIILWLDCNVLPVGGGGGLSGSSGMTPTELFSYIYAVSTAAFILVFDIRRLMPYLKISSLITASGIVIESYMGNSPVSYLAAVLAALGMGHIIAATGYGFFMVLNNAEKLCSVSIGMFISASINLIKVNFADTSGGIELFNIMRILGLLPLLVCTMYYSKADTEDTFVKGERMPSKNYVILVIALFVLLFNDFFSPLLMNSLIFLPEQTLDLYHAIGVFAGIIIVVLYQMMGRSNICYILNFSFGVLALGYVLILQTASAECQLLSAALLGAAYSMGFISLYYISGIILKKYRSLTFYRIAIVLVALFYVVGFSITHALGNAQDQGQLTFIVILCITILMGFFGFTPRITKALYSAEWADDLQRSDVTHVNRLFACLSEYKLSTREKEVCILLLDGYTMRQISAILSISYSTVNTYCTSIYRKLKINSRTELFLMFGDKVSR